MTKIPRAPVGRPLRPDRQRRMALLPQYCGSPHRPLALSHPCKAVTTTITALPTPSTPPTLSMVQTLPTFALLISGQYLPATALLLAPFRYHPAPKLARCFLVPPRTWEQRSQPPLGWNLAESWETPPLHLARPLCPRGCMGAAPLRRRDPLQKRDPALLPSYQQESFKKQNRN